MNDENLVSVQNLNKSFNGKKAVTDLTLNVKRGEIFGFLGPNGSGKTTTIRMLCGLMTPDSGTGQCLGYDIQERSGKTRQMMKRLVGYVPQYFSLYQDLTVRENLEFVARTYRRDYKTRTKHLIEELDLARYSDYLAGSLSGGWKQRLSLAAALIHEPKLLLLDEPTAGVDPKARREFWEYLIQLTTRGISSLVSTHYMDEAERCNRLAYIVFGHLKAEGTASEIIAKSGIYTFMTEGTGYDLATLSKQLQSENAFEQVVVLGNFLRVIGTDENKVAATLKRYDHYHFKKTTPRLEEVFIHYVDEENK